MAGTYADARAKTAHRTIPDTTAANAVSGTPATLDLTAYGGRFIRLTARGAAVTFRRCAVGATPAITAGIGPTLADGAWDEFWVSKAGALGLRVVASGAGSLDISFDSESN